MALETKSTLTDETIDKLQKLIRCNIDSADGFSATAKQLDDPNIANLFRDLSSERSAMATELQGYVEWNGQEAEDDGSFAASVHRAWTNVRTALSSDDTTAILSEAERGEDHIKEAYEDVLKSTAGSAVNDVLTQQYARVKAAHDRVRDLRDARKNAK